MLCGNCGTVKVAGMCPACRVPTRSIPASGQRKAFVSVDPKQRCYTDEMEQRFIGPVTGGVPYAARCGHTADIPGDMCAACVADEKRRLIDPSTGATSTPEKTKGPTPPKEAITNASRYGGWAVDEFIAEMGLGFRLGNVVKYISRAGKKAGQTELDDLRKAQVYLQRHITRLEEGKK